MATAVEVGQQDTVARIVSTFETLARELVDQPEVLRFDSYEHDGTVYIRVESGPEMGKLIGRSGRMARALRTVFAAVAVKNGLRCSLDIV